MKFNTAALVLAAAGLASASPIRVVVVSSAMGDPIEAANNHPGPFRFGHTVAAIKGETMPQAGPAHGLMKQPCAGRMGRFREKALEISNAFRTALGLEPIDPRPPHEFRILPFVGSAPTLIRVDGPSADGTWTGRTKGGEVVKIVSNGPSNVPAPHRHHRPHHHAHHDAPPFMTRLHYSLLNLGTWEGRAVAFVLGCGIGVLLRMLWVLSVVTLRSIRGRDESHHYTVIAVEEVDEALPSPPPTYVYPVDEKIMFEEANKGKPAPQNDAATATEN